MRNALYFYRCPCLGGLAEEVDEKTLHAAFIPFGDITDINIPLDYETGKDTCIFQLFASYMYSPFISYRTRFFKFSLVLLNSHEKICDKVM